VTLKTLFHDALKSALEREAAAPRRMERPQISARRTPPIPARSNAELASNLDDEDLLKSG